MSNTYLQLPDAMTSAELAPHFETVLQQQSGDAAQPLQGAKDLLQLAQRQYASGTSLDAGLKQRVEQWVSAHWQPGDATLTDYLLSLVVVLQLSGCLPLLRQALAAAETTPETRDLIDDALAEYGA